MRSPQKGNIPRCAGPESSDIFPDASPLNGKKDERYPFITYLVNITH
jgi:hypothetical protein